MTRLSFATVLADRIETRYLRAGSGPTVVILRSSPLNADPGLNSLITALVGEFKIIVPEFPSTIPGEIPDRATMLGWIRGVLDGLGVSRALLLVSGQMSWLAAGLQHEDPDRVQGIAVLVDDDGAESIRTAVSGFFRPR